MKYLKLIIFVCIVLQTSFMFSQSNAFECDFIPETSMFDTTKYTATVKSDFSTDEPIVFNVKFHILINENGVEPYGVTEDKLLEHIAQLNINYNQFNIFYKYRGFEEIGGDITYYRPFYDDYFTEPIYDAPINNIVNHLDLVNNQPNSINVLITRNLYAATGSLTNQRVIIPASRVMSSYGFGTMIHEFGHVAGLLHTFEGTRFAPRCLNNPDSEFCIENDTEFQAGADIDGDNYRDVRFVSPRLNIPRYYTDSNAGNEENVTRDQNDINYNADIKGDLVTDTPAEFLGSQHNFWQGWDDACCPGFHHIAHSNIVDLVGDVYTDIDVQNFMSYTELLMTNFTNGQGVRMRETIENNPAVFNRVTEDDASSLYEPYAGEYFFAGPNNPNFRPLFQPGFDYKYVHCGGATSSGFEGYNIPSDYDNISFSYKIHNILNQVDKFSLDLNTITHPNYSAIIIEQLEQQPHKCYHNFNRSASSGTVIKYEDDYPNTNVTIQHKNATEINDENLIQNLENGLYIIKKTFDDGTQEQKTIIKNDN